MRSYLLEALISKLGIQDSAGLRPGWQARARRQDTFSSEPRMDYAREVSRSETLRLIIPPSREAIAGRTSASSVEPLSSSLKKASSDDASFFETEIAAPPRSRGAYDDVIHQLDRQDSAGFENSPGEAQISLRRRRVAGRGEVLYVSRFLLRGPSWLQSAKNHVNNRIDGGIRWWTS